MRTLLLTLLLVLLAGCAATVPPIDHRYTARAQSDRIKYIIIHYTAGNFASSLHTLTEEEVSSHYLLSDAQPPELYQLVDEERQANHAGLSSWKIYDQLNSASIGIEIVNLGYQDTPAGRVWTPFKQSQIDRLIPLLKDIVARHHISPDNILGHNEIAPQRKPDPGPMFPWKQLADAGLITWPDAAQVALRLPQYQAQLPDVAWFQSKLAQHGYAVPHSGVLDQATHNVLVVFQSKFRQGRFDGIPDAESAAILDVLTSPPPSLPAPVMPAMPVIPAAPEAN